MCEGVLRSRRQRIKCSRPSARAKARNRASQCEGEERLDRSLSPADGLEETKYSVTYFFSSSSPNPLISTLLSTQWYRLSAEMGRMVTTKDDRGARRPSKILRMMDFSFISFDISSKPSKTNSTLIPLWVITN